MKNILGIILVIWDYIVYKTSRTYLFVGLFLISQLVMVYLLFAYPLLGVLLWIILLNVYIYYGIVKHDNNAFFFIILTILSFLFIINYIQSNPILNEHITKDIGINIKYNNKERVILYDSNSSKNNLVCLELKEYLVLEMNECKKINIIITEYIKDDTSKFYNSSIIEPRVDIKCMDLNEQNTF